MSQLTETINSSTNSSASTSTLISWWGIKESWADGYEYDGPDEWTQFTVDTNGWPNKIEWGSRHHSWIKVYVTNNTTSSTATEYKTFCFYYRWTGGYPTPWPNYNHIDDFTVNFGPIDEEQEVAPETFLKWLEHLGHDQAFVRIQYKMQKKMMKHTKHLPPWDPRKIEELEQKRVKFQQWVDSLEPEGIEKIKTERLKQRWDIEEIPPLTPELLDQIAESSLNFLKECLSSEEQKFFDEHGHCKIRSPNEPQVYYIIKASDSERVERYEKDELAELICVHSAWGGLPAYDTVAAKVLHIKCAEKVFLKEGNRTRIKSKESVLF